MNSRTASNRHSTRLSLPAAWAAALAATLAAALPQAASAEREEFQQEKFGPLLMSQPQTYHQHQRNSESEGRRGSPSNH